MKIDQAKIRSVSEDFNVRPSVSRRLSVFTDDKKYEVVYLSIDQLVPYQKQARKMFVDVDLDSLALTIKEHGIRQPLTVLRNGADEHFFEVISGERRLRAAKIAGLTKIPCIVVEDAEKAEEIALIENIQRSDLHPLEVGRALKSLIDKIGRGTQSDLTIKLGLSNSQISELIKLTSLDLSVQEVILELNFRGRENLRKLFDFSSNSEKLNFIRGECNSKDKKGQRKIFSVLRFSFNNAELKIQKKPMSFLSNDQKLIIKENLIKLINEIDNSLDI